MPFESPGQLAQVGLRPEGTGPSSPFETIIKSGGQFIGSYFDQQEKETKKAKDKLDMYITLRKAGYSSDQATDTVNKGGYPKTPPDIDYIGREQEATLREKEAGASEKEKHGSYYDKLAQNTGEAGYDNSEDIPDTSNGLPLKKVYQDKKTGKWYGDYGTTTGKTGGIDFKKRLNAKLNPEGDTAKDNSKPGTVGTDKVGWFANFINKVTGPMDRARGAAKSTQPKVPTKKTETRDQIINEAWSEHPEKQREDVIAALVKKGLIEE